MSIAVACPSCGAKFKAPEEAAGKKTRCPKCQTPFVVPGLSGATAPAASPTMAAPVQAPVEVRHRPCPYCGEEILIEAKKCKHCGEMLDPALQAAQEIRQAPMPTAPVMAAPAAVPDGGTLACPVCAVTLRQEANRCWNCGQALDTTMRTAQESQPEPDAFAFAGDADGDASPRRSSRSRPAKRAYGCMGCMGCMGLIVLGVVCMGGLVVFSAQRTQEAVRAANELYDQGRLAEAVTAYKGLYGRAGVDKGEMLRRIVEFETKAGNLDEAKTWIGRGLDDGVKPDYTDPAAEYLYAAVLREQAGARTAKLNGPALDPGPPPPEEEPPQSREDTSAFGCSRSGSSPARRGAAAVPRPARQEGGRRLRPIPGTLAEPVHRGVAGGAGEAQGRQ